MERHPDLQFVFTEQGTAWIPETLRTLDYFFDRMGRAGGSQEMEWGREIVGGLSLPPSGYWARQCHVGSSFLRPSECPLRHEVGVDRIMWGSDYPHLEGSWPYTTEALRLTFAGVDRAEVEAMLAGNAARLYGFDLAALAPVAARVGPAVAEVARPLPAEEIPEGADRCPAFAEATATASPATASQGGRT
jgi:predicted TIM-barrel fold metal-dependent hydrolase